MPDRWHCINEGRRNVGRQWTRWADQLNGLAGDQWSRSAKKFNSIGQSHLLSTQELCPAQQEALLFQGCLAKFIHSFIKSIKNTFVGVAAKINVLFLVIYFLPPVVVYLIIMVIVLINIFERLKRLYYCALYLRIHEP